MNNLKSVILEYEKLQGGEKIIPLRRFVNFILAGGEDRNKTSKPKEIPLKFICEFYKYTARVIKKNNDIVNVFENFDNKRLYKDLGKPQKGSNILIKYYKQAYLYAFNTIDILLKNNMCENIELDQFSEYLRAFCKDIESLTSDKKLQYAFIILASTYPIIEKEVYELYDNPTELMAILVDISVQYSTRIQLIAKEVLKSLKDLDLVRCESQSKSLRMLQKSFFAGIRFLG